MQGSFDGVGQVITDRVRRYRTVLLLERLINRAIEAIRYMCRIRKQPLRNKPIDVVLSHVTKNGHGTLQVSKNTIVRHCCTATGPHREREREADGVESEKLDASCNDLPVPHNSRVEIMPLAIIGVQAVKDALPELKAEPVAPVDCKLCIINIEQLAITNLQRTPLTVPGRHCYTSDKPPRNFRIAQELYACSIA